MIKIFANGEETIIEEKSTIADLVDKIGAQRSAAAVALNGAVSPKEKWGSTELKDGDRVEILRFIGGG